MTLTLSFLMFQLRSNERSGYVINISGMQRMLSQRIGLLSREVSISEDSEQADGLVKKLDMAIEQMRLNHTEMVQKLRGNDRAFFYSVALDDMYFGDDGIDLRVTDFLSLADVFVATYARDGLNGVKNGYGAEKITAIARNGLLYDLNEIVSEYERISEDRMKQFQTFEILFYCLGVFILLLEALFIFRPMTLDVVKTTERLRNSNQELLEFSYRISHDLRAPIVSSLGLLNVAKKALKNNQNDTVEKCIDHVNNSMSSLEKLVDDVVNLTKIKMVDAEGRVFNMQTIIDQALNNIGHLDGFDKIDVRVTNSLDKDVQAKEIYVSQTIENLISNAVKYQKHDHAHPYIVVDVSYENGVCRVCVEDNGIGISEQAQADLFGMFKRFHPRHSFGSGLGLYLVKQNASHLGGRCYYEALEQGSRFVFDFPCDLVEEENEEDYSV